jgi:glycosyltransferase involved in cell wall biosynthesis
VRILLIADAFEQVRGGIEHHADVLESVLRRMGQDVVRYSWADLRNGPLAGYDWCLFDGIQRIGVMLSLLRAGGKAPLFGLFTHGSFSEEAWSGSLRHFGYRPPQPAFTLRRVFDFALMTEILGSMAAIFTLSLSESTEIQRLFRVRPSNLVVIQPFLDLPALASAGADPPFGPDGDRSYVCAVSRIEPRKNFDVALAAAARVGVEFWLAGPDQGGLASVRSVATEVGVESFRYLGVVSEGQRLQLLRNAGATVLPSFLEGIPYMILHSLQLGTPAVCTRFSYIAPTGGLVLCDPTVESVAAGLRKALTMKGSVSRLNGLADCDVGRVVLDHLERRTFG